MNYDHLLRDIGLIHDRSREAAGRSVDRLLTLRNWFIGAGIVEYEQHGVEGGTFLHRAEFLREGDEAWMETKTWKVVEGEKELVTEARLTPLGGQENPQESSSKEKGDR